MANLGLPGPSNALVARTSGGAEEVVGFRFGAPWKALRCGRRLLFRAAVREVSILESRAFGACGAEG